MNSCISLINRFVRNSYQINSLLNRNNKSNVNQLVIREMKGWRVRTLTLMKLRTKSFEAVKRVAEPRNVRQEWNLRSELFAFSQRLTEKFSEENLKIAFTHQSFIDKEIKKREELGLSDVSVNIRDNNDFIESGQNICDFYIKSYLRHFLPRLPEEGVEAIYDYLMSDEVLSDISKWIGCIDLVLCEEFPPKPSTLAKTVKSLVGAIAEDHTIKRAENFVLDFVLTYLLDKDLLEIWDIPNPRFQLKSILSRDNLSAPEYRLLRESAVGTLEACYVIGIYVNKQLISSAPGETIEIAKQMADLDALRKLFGLTPAEVCFKYGPKAYEIDLSQSTGKTIYLNDWKNSSFEKQRQIKESIL